MPWRVRTLRFPCAPGQGLWGGLPSLDRGSAGISPFASSQEQTWTQILS